MSFIQDGIPTAADWWNLLTGGVGPCMGQKQTEICGSAMYPLSMPPPPDIGPMKVSCYLGLAGLLTTALTKYVNEMASNSKLWVSAKKTKRKEKERFQYWSK